MTRPTLVIGAGPAGLAVAASLKRCGLPVRLVDRAPTIGHSWRHHYRRLHLHTAAEHSHLPFLEMPAHYPTYPSREQVVAYLEDYARHFGLEPELETDITCAKRNSSHKGFWQLDTSRGPIEADALVVATGYSSSPVRPTWPGLETAAFQVMHTADYRDGAPFAGKSVLIVGAGNSGAEIAIDLWEHGARPTMAIRGPVHVVPRDLFGIPAQTLSIALDHLPHAVADRLSEPLRDLLIGDLTPFGIRRPNRGPLSLLTATGRVPLVDIGTVALIRQGAILVRPDLARVDGDHVIFVDDRRDRFDLILLATGYRASFDRWLHCPEALDSRGLPRRHGEEVSPGLFFCGFKNPTTGALREIRLEAMRIADQLASKARA